MAEIRAEGVSLGVVRQRERSHAWQGRPGPIKDRKQRAAFTVELEMITG